MNALHPSVIQRSLKKAFAVFLLILCIALVVATCQSIRFSSSLWVIARFGFDHWQEYIARMLNSLVIWAIITGVMFASETLTHPKATGAAKVLVGTALGFCMGFICTYFFAVVLGVVIYVPLGLLSFIFPGSVNFTSMGFAFLCSTYVVFLLIAVDTPSLLMEVVKKAPPYFKLLALLLAALLVVQVLSMIVSILRILMQYSIWRVHLPAFIIAFGGALLVTVLTNLLIIREGTHTGKVLRIAVAFILSIVTANISEGMFHWGEYAAAIAAALFGPIAYSVLINTFQKNAATMSSAFAGLAGGLGTGLLITNIVGLRIIGQGWFGIGCGSMIALGLGVSFGLMFGPRLAELVTKVAKVRPVIGMCIGIGFMVGIMIGMVAGGLVNR